MSLSLPTQRLLAAGDLASARKDASALFKEKCGACHDSPEDTYQIFGPGWLPCATVEGGACKDSPEEKQALIERIIRSVNYQSGVKKMPPPKKEGRKPDYNAIRGQLDAGQLALLQSWADTEKNPPTSPAPGTGGSGPPQEPAPPVKPAVCKVAEEAPKPGDSKVVTDAQAAAIMGNSCSGCHGKLFTLNSRETKSLIGTALAGAFALAAIKGAKWVKENLGKAHEKKPAPELSTTRPGVGQVLGYCFRNLIRDKFALASKATIAGTVALSAYILGVSQAARHAHIKGKTYNDGDELDPEAAARGDLSLSKYHAEIVSGRMPVDVPAFPERAALIFSVGYPSDSDRETLARWLKQLQESKLSEGCVTYAVNDDLSYQKAADRCNGMGMRLPTTGQLEAIAAQQAGSFSSGSCVWSSGFSDDTSAPRQAYFPGKGIGPQKTGASCRSVCLR